MDVSAVNAVEALRAVGSLPFSSLRERLGEGGLVVIAPHPDDESLACGGLIALASAQGRDVRVVVVSDGTGSHPASKKYPRNRLRALRETEARAAVGALGVAARHVVFLRLPDRFVPSKGPLAEAASEKIIACAHAVAAKALFVSWRHDPHCDHQASYKLARAAQRRLAGVALYEYTVWGASLAPDSPVTPLIDGFRVSIAHHRRRKDRAIAAHRSQTTGLIDDDPGGFRLSPSDLARFAKPYESFFRGAP